MAEMITLLKKIAKASGTATAVAQFVQGGALVQTLNEVGTRHFKAAIQSLSDARHSPRPKERVNSAIPSIIEAYTHIAPRYDAKFTLLLRRSTIISARFLAQSYMSAAVCAFLVALCYRLVGESTVNIQKWVTRAKEDFDQWELEYGWSPSGGIGLYGLVGGPDSVARREITERRELVEIIAKQLTAK